MILGLSAFAASVALAAPTVKNVVMTQGADRLVTVTYDLEDEDAIVTLSVETNGVPLAEGEVANLSGDVNKVVAAGNNKSIIWRACQSWPNHKVENARARVTAWSKKSPPQYLVIDLLKGSSAKAGNLMPSYYYTSAAAVPGGVTNIRYKTTHMLFRRVEPTDDFGFLMGSPDSETGRNSSHEIRHTVKFANHAPFYLGVYEFTQGQRFYLLDEAVTATEATAATGFWAAKLMPRLMTDGTWPYDPTSDASASSRTIYTALKARTGFCFNLPTEAQWEYACRAGTTGALNDGTANLESEEKDSHLDELGLYKGSPDGGNGPSEVGRFKPNAWGFYDMHGNVREWTCSQINNSTSAEQMDPAAMAGTKLAGDYDVRGGHWNSDAKDCRSAYRSAHSYSGPGSSVEADDKLYTGVRFALSCSEL